MLELTFPSVIDIVTHAEFCALAPLCLESLTGQRKYTHMNSYKRGGSVQQSGVPRKYILHCLLVIFTLANRAFSICFIWYNRT